MSPQIGRIARLLRLDPDQVQGLDGLPEDDLRTLHDQISHTLFGDAQQRFARIAGLSKTIPGPVAGVLAEKFLPPVMAARTAEMLDPAKARDLIGRVSVGYLAEIALALDPVKSKPVVQKLPPGPIGKVAKELFGRKEYATMAEFVGTVTVEALFAALDAATPHDLLAVVPLLEWNDNLDKVIAELPHRQVTEIADGLTPVELADLALALDPSRMGPIVAAVPVETVAGIARALFERREYAGMAAFVGVVTPEMLHAALGVASGHDLLAVVPLLEWNDNLDRVIAELEPAQVEAIVAELDVDELADLAMVLDPSRMGPIVAAVSVETVAGIARALFERREYAGMAAFVGVVTPEMMRAALEVASGRDLLAVFPLLEWNENLDRVVADLPPGKIEAVAAEVEASELADLVLALEPERFGPILAAVPGETVAEIASVLFARGEHAALAGFVGVVTPEMMHAALEVASGRDLLAVFPLLEWNENLDRVVADLPPGKVDAIAQEVEPAELADLVLALEPERFAPVLAAVPEQTVAEIARVLFERGEYAGAARFVGVVTPKMMHAALEVASGRDLLAVFPLLEWNENLDRVVADLPPGKVDAIAQEVEPAELADLVLALEPERFAPVLAAVPEQTVAEIARVLLERQEYVGAARFVGVVTPAMLHAALGVASARDLLAVVPLLDWTPEVDAVVDQLPDGTLDALFAEIAGTADWETAKVAFERLGETAQQRLFARFGRLSEQHQQTVRAAADAGELGGAASRLMASLTT